MLKMIAFTFALLMTALPAVAPIATARDATLAAAGTVSVVRQDFAYGTRACASVPVVLSLRVSGSQFDATVLATSDTNPFSHLSTCHYNMPLIGSNAWSSRHPDLAVGCFPGPISHPASITYFPANETYMIVNRIAYCDGGSATQRALFAVGPTSLRFSFFEHLTGSHVMTIEGLLARA